MLLREMKMRVVGGGQAACGDGPGVPWSWSPSSGIWPCLLSLCKRPLQSDVNEKNLIDLRKEFSPGPREDGPGSRAPGSPEAASDVRK